jgi:hypothetical protein
MSNALLVRKVIEQLVKELKSSNMHPSDADWYIGFGDDVNTANEAAVERDPRTGAVVKNNMIGDYTTFLQQWDADNVGYVEEEEDVKRDDGKGIARIVMQQITPIK